MRMRKQSRGLRHRADASRFLSLGIGDDAALVYVTPGYEIVLTCDWFLEGTHFLRDKHPADAVGWKCLARAVSDIAAMGAVPRCFLLSLALPRELAGSWLNELLGGLRRGGKGVGGSLAARAGGAAFGSAAGRHYLCERAAGGSGVGIAIAIASRREARIELTGSALA